MASSQKIKLIILFGLTLIVSSKNCLSQEVDSKLWNRIHSLTEKSDSIYKYDITKAEILLDSAFELITEPVDSIKLNKLLGDMGYIQQVKGNYEGAIALFRKSLNITEAFGDKRRMSIAFLNFGNLYYLINDFENSKKYTRLSIKYLDESDSPPRFYGSRYNVLGLNYFDNDELDSALFYFTIGLTKLSQDSLSKESTYETLFDNIGQIFEMQMDYSKAIEYYRKSLEICLRNQWTESILWSTNKLISAFLVYDSKDSATKYLRLAKEWSPKLANKENELGLLKAEIDFYAKYLDEDSLETKLFLFITLTQELIEAKTLSNIQEMEAKYQLEKNAADLLLAEEKSLTLVQKNKNQRIVLFIFIVIFVVLLGFTFLIRRFYLQKRKVSLLEIEVKDKRLDELMASQETETLAAMIEGQETERNRIARDLHDRLGGTLAALKLSLRRPENIVLKEDLEIVDQAVQEVRDISHNLSGGLLAKYGLNDALQQLRATVERSGGIKFNVYLHPAIAKLSQNVTLELYRIVQELVSNTLKHADASEISIQTNMNKEVFNLIYEDNGKGFNPKKVKAGIGLDNIKSRINQINGTIHWDSAERRGTIVIIELA